MNKQPKDYVKEDFEEFLNKGYEALPWYLKVVYHLQNYIVPVLLGTFATGYLAGMYYGKFW